MARVLVVDDNADVRLLVRRILGRAGLEVEEAGDGRAALERLAEDPCPQLVVLDVQMPDMDGWEVLRCIRAEPRTARLRVLMCTVKARPEDASRGWELGCDAYVDKPFDAERLREVALELVEG